MIAESPVSLNQIHRLIERSDFISFDIFDTLLSRKLTHPTAVFHLVQSRLIKEPLCLKCPSVVLNFPSIRIQAEEEARQRLISLGKEGEVNFDEIYEQFQAKTEVEPELVEIFKKTELEVEKLFIYANKTGKSLLEYAQSVGKKIAFITDMYLPKSFLHEILLSQGIQISEDMIFISGELKCSKHTGSIYSHIQTTLHVPFSQWLHIGDNFFSDIQKAKEWGIKTFQANWSNSFKNESNSFEEITGFAIHSIIHFNETKQALQFVPSPSQEWEELGYRVFGPLFFGFMIWLRLEIKKHDLNKLLFLARDGSFLMKLYDRYLAFLSPELEYCYLFISRSAVYPLSFVEWGEHHIFKLFPSIPNRVKRTVQEILDAIKLKPELVLRELEKEKLSPKQTITTADENMKLFRVINRVYLLLLQESKKHREQLNKYFLDVVGKAERVGIIDVRWYGNVAVSIKDSISQISNKIKFYGFFVGLLSPPSRHNLILKAWLNSINIHFNLGELIQTGGAEFLEFALSSSHGSVLSYERFDGKVIPILEDISGEEIENIAKAKKLQAGVLEYFEHNKFLFEKFPLEGLLSKEWAVPFVRLLTSPSKREAELLGELTHSDSLGKNSKRSKLAPELPLWHRILKTKRYWREFDHSFWKKGFLVRNQF